jgi:hypothetical protein
MLLEEAIPYHGFVGINPPLIDCLIVPPVWLARTLSVSPIVAFQELAIRLLVTTLEVSVLVRNRRCGLRRVEQEAVVLAWMSLCLLVDWRGDVAHLRPRPVFIHDGTGWLGLREEFNMFDYLCYYGRTERALSSYGEIPARRDGRPSSECGRNSVQRGSQPLAGSIFRS